MLKNRAVLLLGLSCFVVGCHANKTFSPKLAPVQAIISGLPASKVRLTVNDLRTKRDNGDTLSGVLRNQIARVLVPGSGTATTHELQIDAVEHQVNKAWFTWNATTRLRARVVNPDGTRMPDMVANGTGSGVDWWSNRSAKGAMQRAYNAAISDLLAQLNAQALK